MEGSALSKKQRSDYAKEHDAKLVAAVEGLSKSVIDVGRELMAMRDEVIEPWKFIKNPVTDLPFENWRSYAKFKLGKMSQASMYEHVCCYQLTVGDNPISQKDVEELGLKKTLVIAKLPASKRSKAIIEKAKSSRLLEVRNLVADKLGEPRIERMHTVIFNVPEPIFQLWEEFSEDAIWIEGIRDSDDSVSLRAKLFHALIVNFRENHQQELIEAKQYNQASFHGAALHG